MIFGKTKLELKVGAFVFLGLIVLMIFVVYIGDFKTWGTGYRFNIIFEFINGVKVGAPVRFAGLDVGEVKKIDLFFSPEQARTKVKLVCLVRREARVPYDSTAWVNTLGLLGEKYIEIMPGKDYKNCFAENQTLVGIDPIPMHEVFNLAKNVVDHLDESIVKIKNKEGTIGKLLYDDTIYKELEALMIDIRKNPWKLLRKTKEKK